MFDNIQWAKFSHFKKCYQKGQVIDLNMNDEKYCAVIQSGCVNIYNMNEDGKYIYLSTLFPKDIIGIAQLFYSPSSEMMLEAECETTVLLINQMMLKKLILTSPVLLEEYLEKMNQKIYFLLNKIALFTLDSIQERIYRALCLYAEKDGQVSIPFGKNELAHRLGISRATFYRELKKMNENGKIKLIGRKLWIKGR